MSDKPRCTDCRFCIKQDTGYSNYTVEGCDADCLLGLNPALPDDAFYGKAESLDYAATCIRFQAGNPVEVDVDHDQGALEEYSDDPEIKALLRSYNA